MLLNAVDDEDRLCLVNSDQIFYLLPAEDKGSDMFKAMIKDKPAVRFYISKMELKRWDMGAFI